MTASTLSPRGWARFSILTTQVLLLAMAGCGPKSIADRRFAAVDIGVPGQGGVSGGQGGSGGSTPASTGGAPSAPDAEGSDEVAEPIDTAPVDLRPPRPEVAPEFTPDVNRLLGGHWRLDEGMGNVAMDTGPVGNHAGTVNILPSDWKPGKRGMSLLFTPARKTFVQVFDHQALNSPEGISVSLWVNANNWNDTPILLQKGEADEQYALRVLAGQLRFTVRLSNGIVTHVVAPAPPTNKWVHIAATHDTYDARLYIDGTSVASISAPESPMSGTNNLTVAGRGAGAMESEFYAGLLDDLIIYSRGLNAAEVKTLAQAKSP